MGRERDLNLVSNNTGMRRKEILIMRLNKLLSPGKIGTLELKNRFVVPPMGTNFATYEVFSDNAASQGYEPTHVVRQLHWML